MIAVLLLTIAGHQTSQEINAWLLDYGVQKFNYTDANNALHLCSGVTQFNFNGTTVAVTASVCEPDEVFENGFES